MMIEKQLHTAGLSENQAKIYTLLLSKKELPASIIQRHTGITRPLTYHTLDQLIDMKLVEKKDVPKQISLFSVSHPYKLQNIIEQKRSKVAEAELALDDIFENLVTQFNTISGKPGVISLEGIDGIHKLNKDILKENSDLSIIRSIHDSEVEKTRKITEEQLKKQAKQNIHIRAITPTPVENIMTKQSTLATFERDAQELRNRRYVPHTLFGFPAQITIFGSKIGITTYKKPQITTIIEQPDIVNTFTLMFELMWAATELHHEAILRDLGCEMPNQ